MKTIQYKSLRVFLSKKMGIANKLPFVPYNNFHFENIKRYRIFRPHPYDKNITNIYGVLSNDKEYTTYEDYCLNDTAK